MSFNSVFRSKRMRAVWILMAVGGLASVIIGIAIGVGVPRLFEGAVSSLLVVSSNSSLGYKSWVSEEIKPEDGAPLHLYLFNITNPGGVAGGAKPALDLVGPYDYKVVKRAADVEFLEDGKEAFSVDRTVYMPQSTGRDPTEPINTLNFVYIGVLGQAHGEAGLTVAITANIVQKVTEGLLGPAITSGLLIGGTSGIFGEVLAPASAAGPAALNALLTYWANATSDDLANFPLPGLRLSGSTASGLSAAKSLAVWQTLVNYTLVGQWVQTQTAPIATLTAGENQQVTMWLLGFVQTTAPAILSAAFGCSADLSDIGIAQWATGAPAGGQSILPAPMQNFEYFKWNAAQATPQPLTAAQAKVILTGLSSPTGLGGFYQLLGTGRFDLITATFGIDQLHAVALATYLQTYVVPNYVMPAFQDAISGSGFIKKTSAEGFLFGGPDTLYSLLTSLPSAPGMMTNDSSVQDALAHNKTTLKLTGKGDRDSIGEILALDGEEYVNFWAEPVKIEGTTGTQFKPFNVFPKTYVPVMWDAFSARPIEFEFIKWEALYGILPTARYDLAEDQLFVEDPKFFNYLPGFCNMTAQSGLPLFYSRPFLNHPDALAFRSNYTLTGADDKVDVDLPYHFNIEPLLGLPLRAQIVLQLNIFVTPALKAQLSITMPGIQENSVLPVGYVVTAATATKNQAIQLKKMLGIRTLAAAALPAGIVIGLILLIAGLVLLTISLIKGRSASNTVRPVMIAPDGN